MHRYTGINNQKDSVLSFANKSIKVFINPNLITGSLNSFLLSFGYFLVAQLEFVEHND